MGFGFWVYDFIYIDILFLVPTLGVGTSPHRSAVLTLRAAAYRDHRGMDWTIPEDRRKLVPTVTVGTRSDRGNEDRN